MSLTLFSFSAINVLTYLFLGIILGNTAYSEIFSLTYPLQFAVVILLNLFVSASCIRSNKENNSNCVTSGMLLGLLFGATIFGLVAGFIDGYITFMNMDTAIYHNFALMSVGQLFFAFINNMVAERMYFLGQDKKANLVSLGFILLNFVSVILTALCTKNQLIIVFVNLGSLLIYTAVWFALSLKKFKFEFSIVKNFRLESLSLVSNIFMLIIYLFGYSTAFSFGAQYVISLNFVNLVTDPQWDAFDSISKIAKIDISNSNYNYKKAMKDSIVITIFYILSSVVLFFALFKVFNVTLWIGLVCLGIQAIDMFIYAFKSNSQTFLQLEYSASKSTTVNLVCKIVRTVLSVFIINPFNTNIAQLVAGFMSFLIFEIIRVKTFKVDKDGTLVLREKVKKPNKISQPENEKTEL